LHSQKNQKSIMKNEVLCMHFHLIKIKNTHFHIIIHSINTNGNCQNPISSGQIKLFQNIKQYIVKIKMCVII